MITHSGLPYLPQWATALEAATWMTAATGQDWPVARLFESPVEMYLEIRARPDEPKFVREHVFQGQDSLYIDVSFVADRRALAFSRAEAQVSMFQRPDGATVQVKPPLRFPAEEIRFSRAGLHRLADAVDRGADLDGDKRFFMKVGPIEVFEAEPGVSRFLELHGGLSALDGATIEILNFKAIDDSAEPELSGGAPAIEATSAWDTDEKLLARYAELGGDGTRGVLAALAKEVDRHPKTVKERLERAQARAGPTTASWFPKPK